MIVFFHKFQSEAIVSNHFHLTPCMDQELSTLLRLHPIMVMYMH